MDCECGVKTSNDSIVVCSEEDEARHHSSTATAPAIFAPEIEGFLGVVDDDDNLTWKELGHKYLSVLGGIKNVVIDIEGTLIFEDLDGVKAYPEAGEFIEMLRSHQMNVYFITNSYKGSKTKICNTFKTVDIKASCSEVFTSAEAAVAFMKKHRYRPYFLIDNEMNCEFQELDESSPNCVVIGLPSTQIEYRLMGKALAMLMDQCPIISLNEKLTELTEGSSYLIGSKPFVDIMHFATGAKIFSVGKPSMNFFKAFIDAKKIDPKETVLIGDDPYEDISTSKELGFRTILVKTGAYQQSTNPRGHLCDLEVEDFKKAAEYILKTYAVENKIKYGDGSDSEEEDDMTKGALNKTLLNLQCTKTPSEQQDFISRLVAYAREPFKREQRTVCGKNPPSDVW